MQKRLAYEEQSVPGEMEGLLLKLESTARGVRREIAQVICRRKESLV